MKEKELNKNIQMALGCAWSYGQIDGDHHKTWVIDQMVRCLCGSEEKYKKWVEEYEAALTCDEYYSWDVGIAP